MVGSAVAHIGVCNESFHREARERAVWGPAPSEAPAEADQVWLFCGGSC